MWGLCCVCARSAGCGNVCWQPALPRLRRAHRVLPCRPPPPDPLPLPCCPPAASPLPAPPCPHLTTAQAHQALRGQRLDGPQADVPGWVGGWVGGGDGMGGRCYGWVGRQRADSHPCPSAPSAPLPPTLPLSAHHCTSPPVHLCTCAPPLQAPLTRRSRLPTRTTSARCAAARHAPRPSTSRSPTTPRRCCPCCTRCPT